MEEDRWVRLERYARWRQRRLRVDLLPPDVFAIVCTHLDHESKTALLRAVSGRVPPAGIPREVRSAWLCEHAAARLHASLLSLKDTTCFYARHLTRGVYAFGDWSPFRGVTPDALARFEWRGTRWTANVDRAAVWRHVREMMRKAACSTRVSLHLVSPPHTVHTRDARVILVHLLPPAL